LFSYILYNPIFIICQACSLALAACCLWLVAYLFKKLPTTLQISLGQRAMVISEPWQQVVVFNSLH
jgi:hypothetical protein